MTISDFSRDIESRTNRYVHLGVEDKMLPYLTILHISEVNAVDEFPAFILFTDGVNKMMLTQIQSIELDRDHYNIVCGDYDSMRTCVVVYFDSQ